MREIKFRAWDKCLNKMIYSLEIPSDYTERNGQLDLLNMFQVLSRRYIFMQYTGFKDKNGKEIYEGDAVQRFNDNPVRFPDGSKKYSSWMVVFEYGGWKFKDTPCSPTTSYPSFYSNAQYMEIIGNIYENPELLGGDGK